MAATKALYIDQNEDSSVCDSTFENPGQSSVRKIQLQGGYECFFVKDPPPELQTDCSICLCLLREPHLMDCKCGTNFCRTCIEPVKVEGKPCPLCNSSFTTAIPNRQLERVLNEMLVYCSRRDFGCDWKGELVSLPLHLNVEPSNEERLSGCQFAALNCCHCHDSVLRKDIIDHQVNKCLQRPYSCDYCHNYESTCEDVTDNHWPICPFRPSPCPNECGVYPERHNLEKHLENDCPETTIPCPFSYAGCQERLPRREMPRHISEKLAAHMSLQAASHQQQLETFQAALNSQRTNHEKQVEQFQQTLSLQASKYQKGLCEIQETLSAQIATSQQELKKLQKTIACHGAIHEQQMEKFQRAVQNLSSENENLKLQIQEVYSEKQTLHEELKRICELNGNLDQRTHALERESMAIKSRVGQQAEKLTDLLKQSKSLTKTIQEIKKDQTSDKENHKSLKKELQHSISDFQRDSKSKVVTVQQEVGKLQLDVESLKKSVEQTKDKLSELEKETKALKIKLDEKGLSHVSPDAKMNPKPVKVDGRDLKIQRIEGDISEIKSEMKESVKVHIGLVPLEVTMHNFRQHKTLSMDWFSSPFYTHPRGYKLKCA